jgi:hypothetical protein
MKNSVLPEFQTSFFSAPLFLQEVDLFILTARKKGVVTAFFSNVEERGGTAK